MKFVIFIQIDIILFKFDKIVLIDWYKYRSKFPPLKWAQRNELIMLTIDAPNP